MTELIGIWGVIGSPEGFAKFGIAPGLGRRSPARGRWGSRLAQGTAIPLGGRIPGGMVRKQQYVKERVRLGGGADSRGGRNRGGRRHGAPVQRQTTRPWIYGSTGLGDSYSTGRNLAGFFGGAGWENENRNCHGNNGNEGVKAASGKETCKEGDLTAARTTLRSFAGR